jgi:predicted nucleotidyltransferase
MATVAEASLTPAERRALDRFVGLLKEELGPALHGVWLYGSRARGEPVGAESDVDLIVISSRQGPDDDLRIIRLADQAAEAEGAGLALFSVQLYSPERLDQRREIRSFFVQEVDRDKIVLYGEP